MYSFNLLDGTTMVVSHCIFKTIKQNKMKKLIKPLMVLGVYLLLLMVIYCVLPCIVFVLSGFNTSAFTTVSQSPYYIIIFIFIVPIALAIWMDDTLMN